MKNLVTPAVVALCLLATPAPASQTVRLNSNEQARAGVVVRPVLERSFGDQFRVVGQVVRSPGSTVPVKVVVPGRIEEILATPGSRVKRGEPVLLMHSHALHGLQADFLRAAERLRLAEIRLEAGRKLLELEGISRIELEDREQQAFGARLEVEATRAELKDLGYTETELEEIANRRNPDPHLTIRAPAGGVVLELGVEPQEWVQAYRLLMVIGDPSRVELELQIPPDQASSVSRGDLVEFIPVARPEAVGHATVVTSVPQVDPTTRTIVIRASISDSQAPLVPGVFVEGSLTHGEARSAPSVPEAAVTRLGDNDVVFVQVGPDTFEIRPVVLGQFNGTRFEVKSGVEPGEDVVVKGVFFLKSAVLKGTSGEE